MHLMTRDPPAQVTTKVMYGDSIGTLEGPREVLFICTCGRAPIGTCSYYLGIAQAVDRNRSTPLMSVSLTSCPGTRRETA